MPSNLSINVDNLVLGVLAAQGSQEKPLALDRKIVHQGFLALKDQLPELCSQYRLIDQASKYLIADDDEYCRAVTAALAQLQLGGSIYWENNSPQIVRSRLTQVPRWLPGSETFYKKCADVFETALSRLAS